MRVKLKEGEFLIWALLTLVILIAWTSSIWLILTSYQGNKEALLNIELKRFEGELHATLNTYESFSNYIYDEISSDHEILDIIKAANNSHGDEKDKLRKNLYNLVEKKYSYMKKYDFKQLHFHLPNTESFLRVHSPNQYGDILFSIRESVRLANERQEYISGFEEGRVYNGFRYVYPINYEGRHLGTVEVSISSGSVLKILSELYPNEDFHFIIYKDIIEKSIFDSEKGNYVGAPISDLFYVDKEVEEIVKKYNSLANHEEDGFFCGIEEDFIGAIQKNHSFPALYTCKGKDYRINFVSIKNISNEAVGYIISLRQTNEFKYLKKDMYKQIILISLLAIFIIAFSFIMMIYQRKLKNMSQKDFLTKIFNRQKFFEIADRECKRAKRYDYDMAMLMIDIDYFKRVNDTYGHDQGDRVLRELSSLVSKNIRDTDIFARWGGEEFVILLAHTNKIEAMMVAEKIRKLVDDYKMGNLKDITVSIGVAMLDKENYNILAGIEKADEAMYMAKNAGRNRVCIIDNE